MVVKTCCINKII